MRNDYYEEGLSVRLPIVIPVFNHKDITGTMGKIDNNFFHGRLEIQQRLKSILLNDNNNGCILVAGYKGVGKTSLINNVINSVKKEIGNKEHLLDLRISLGSSRTLSQSIVFSYIVDELELVFFDTVSEIISEKWLYKYRAFDIQDHKQELETFLSDIIVNKSASKHEPLFYALSFFGSAYKKKGFPTLIKKIIPYFFDSSFKRKKIERLFQDLASIFRQLKFLREELEKGTIENSDEDSTQNDLSMGDTLIPFTASSSNNSKNTRTFQRNTGNIQRIEKSLINIIKQINELNIFKRRMTVLITFDELDKVKSSGKGINQEILSRKIEIEKFLDNSKNFLTACDTRFIFVGDRDLYEVTKRYRKDGGTHAGIFRKIFLVESFMTDHSDGDESRLASMIESFVIRRLMDSKDIAHINKQYMSVKDLYNCHSKYKYKNKNKKSTDDFYLQSEKELRMDMLLIRHLIHYITINSKGIATGVNDIYQSFIRRTDINFISNRGNNKESTYKDFLPSYLNQEQKDNVEHVIVINERRLPEIKWSSDNYIILHRRLSLLLSKYDDKVVASLISIFHHIQKLYFVGFERKDIERTAELLNIHREEGIDRLVRTMLGTIFSPSIRHFKGILNQYRFVTLFQHEIRYVLSIKDKDSFDYQFTQEELLPIMQHYLGEDFSGGSGLSQEIKKIESMNDLITIGNLSSFTRQYEDSIKCYRAAEDLIEKKRNSEFGKGSLELLQDHVKVKLRIANAMERSLGNKTDIINEYSQSQILLTQYEEEHPNTSQLNHLKQEVYTAKMFMLLESNPLKMLATTAETVNNIISYNSADKEEFFDEVFSDIHNVKVDENTLNSLLGLSRLMFFSNQNRKAIQLLMLLVDKSQILTKTRKFFAMTGALGLQRLGTSLVVFHMSQLHKTIVTRHSNYNMTKTGAVYKKATCDFFKEEIYNQLLTLKGIKSVDDLIKISFDTTEGIGKDYDKEVEINEIWSVLKTRLKGITDNEETPLSAFKLCMSLSLIALSAKKMEAVQQHRNAAEAYITIIFNWGVYLEAVPWSLLTFDDQNKSELLELSRSISCLILDIGNRASKCMSLSNNKSYSNFIHSFWMGMLKNDDEKSDNFPSELDLSKLVDPVNTIFGCYSDSEKNKISKKVMEMYTGEPIFWEHSIPGKNLVQLLTWENKARECVLGLDETHKIPIMGIQHRLPYSIRSHISSLWTTARIQLKEARDADTFDQALAPSAKAIQNLYLGINTGERVTGDYQDIVFPPPYLLKYNLWEVIFNLISKYTTEKTTSDFNTIVYKVKRELMKYRSITSSFSLEIPTTYMNYNHVKDNAVTELTISQNFGDITGNSMESIMDTKRYLESDFHDNYLYLDWSCYQMSGGSSVIHKIHITMEEEKLQKVLDGKV